MSEKDNAWKGYTFDELKFRRVLSLTKIELEKNAMMQKLHLVHKSNAAPTTMVGKVLGSFDYLDYGVMAFKFVKRIVRWFKK